MKKFLAILIMLSVLDRSIDLDHLIWDQTHCASGWHDDIDSFSELILEFVLNDENFVSETDNDQGSPSHSQNGSGPSGPIAITSPWACPDQGTIGLPSPIHLIEQNSTPLPEPWLGVTSKGFKRISSPPPDFLLA